MKVPASGSLPTFAAFANRKNWVAAPSVRFLQVAQFSLQAQRRSEIRPYYRNMRDAAIRPTHSHINVVNGPNRTSVHCAANGGSEPTLPVFYNAANVSSCDLLA
ncbi:hypothetical protein, partial [Falsihalocynthiibacter arcticus]|uniref:hypothetical protein n=1 Tax=Falsihalocynthiibacter arcticus TaxID=1579316 RepID=UPI003001690E